ncbi:MAG TPA: hypothetical protein VMT53_27550 [Terriglobales bacterium]|nr:hypothetical protein [Terriglobales bacterium]
MNAAKVAAAGEHHQQRLGLGVGLVVLEVEKHPQLYRVKLLWPVALFASFSGGDKAIAFHGRFDRIMDAMENSVSQLPQAALLTSHPANSTRGNVAIYALHVRVRRVLVGDELWFHDVTALSAELGRFHMLNSTIGALGPNHDVNCSGYSEKDCKLPKHSSPVGGRQQRLLVAFDAPPRQEDSERDQYEADDEDNRDYEKDHYADVGVAGVASKLDWQNEEPGKAGGRH